MTYVGDKPWTNQPLTEINMPPPPDGVMYNPTENWAALMMDNSFSVGIYHVKGTPRFKSFFNGKKG